MIALPFLIEDEDEEDDGQKAVRPPFEILYAGDYSDQSLLVKKNSGFIITRPLRLFMEQQIHVT